MIQFQKYFKLDHNFRLSFQHIENIANDYGINTMHQLNI
jgi:hypothetical protein